MSKSDEEAYKVGPYWLSRANGSQAWYRTWYDPEKRRTKRSSLKTSDFGEAKQRLMDWVVKNHRQSELEAGDADLATILLRYWEDHAKHQEGSSVVKTHLRYWTEHFPRKSIAEATEFSAMKKFKSDLAERGYAPATVNRILAVGKAAMNQAWKKGELAKVPPIPMERVGRQEPMGRPLSVQECADLLDCAKTRDADHLWRFIIFALGTAARPRAILDLQYGQIDLEEKLIDLNPPGRNQNKKYRPIVRLPDALSEIVESDGRMARDAHVVSYRGERLVSVRTSWRKVREDAGLDEEVTLYSFRHTIGRRLRARGVPAWEVAAQLGHKTAGVTDRYASFSPDYLEGAVSVIEELLLDIARKTRASGCLDSSAKSLSLLVPVIGLEPTTPSLRMTCSTS